MRLCQSQRTRTSSSPETILLNSVFPDLSEIFDRLDQSILLETSSGLDAPRTPVSWLYSSHTGSHFSAFFAIFFSPQLVTGVRMPALGSVLGLFSTYTSTLTELIQPLLNIISTLMTATCQGSVGGGSKIQNLREFEVVDFPTYCSCGVPSHT